MYDETNHHPSSYWRNNIILRIRINILPHTDASSVIDKIIKKNKNKLHIHVLSFFLYQIMCFNPEKKKQIHTHLYPANIIKKKTLFL